MWHVEQDNAARLARLVSDDLQALDVAHGRPDNQTLQMREAEVRATFRRTRAANDDEHVAVRIYGPEQASGGEPSGWTPVLYHSDIRHLDTIHASIAERIRLHVNRYKGRPARKGRLLQSVQRRAAIVKQHLPWVRNLSGQLRCDIPGGGRVDFSGADQHDVTISSLTDDQLETVVRALTPILGGRR